MCKTFAELEQQRDMLSAKFGVPKRNQVVPGEILEHVRDVIAWATTQKLQPDTTILMVPGGW